MCNIRCKIQKRYKIMKKYVIGIDFGTLSGRTVLFDAKDGREIAVSELAYPHAVMDDTLPSGKKLPEQFALQHPEDYLEVLRTTIPDVLKQSGISAEDVAGLGIDFTACTLMPVDANGTPLCMTERFFDEPHAYVKLWKHHAAQAEADEVTRVAHERGEDWIETFGSKISSEWAVPKILETLHKAPEVYEAADRFYEAGDWLSLVLTGEESHAAVFAGYKALWRAGKGYPSKEYFKALDPRLENLIGTKLSAEVRTVDKIAGRISEAGAALTGLAVGTALALPMIDAHAALPAIGAVNAGDIVMIIGTSSCHIMHADKKADVPGICGYVEDGVIPGCTTYEAGQSCVGDGFAWFVDNLVPAAYTEEAKAKGISIHKLLREKASALEVGESGLLALDWMGGNRSVLNNANLSGVILGLTLATRAEEIYRALLEATAYGSRVIIEQFEKNGLDVREIRAAGGIAKKDPLMMQIYADVLKKPILVADTTQAGAVGSAIYAAYAAGMYPTVNDAAKTLAVGCSTKYEPIPANSEKYEKLYAEYVKLHDYFGRGENDVMLKLR